MIHFRETPEMTKLKFEYDDTVYDPHYTSSDPLVIADALIRKSQRQLKVLDLGCGCGVLGLTLKKLHPYLDITLCDIDKNAIKWSKHNAKQLKLDVKVVKSDLFKNLGRFDLIITTLPSFSADQPTKQPLHTVRDPDLILYKKLFKKAPTDILVVEFQKPRQTELLKLTTGWKEILQTDYGYAFLRKTSIQN